ncbi:hypothetical protein GOP47_0013325 [Adiantum capillus-veneris]|uniref:BZIP domain-containing protein n=1 Tax=Adiantum capillus-veneris TaxID=13818 RepID=A0A9D4UNB4_ADICA|nr:hypothetical protein GOP47_0013325 [Adiantum capillus-veneris]
MIKNRESAARSRARKQAYTVELEAEVSQLKEENMKLLRKQEEEAARRKKQILAFMPAAGNGAGYKERFVSLHDSNLEIIGSLGEGGYRQVFKVKRNHQSNSSGELELLPCGANHIMACKILVKELSAHETHRKHQLRLVGAEIRIMRRQSTHVVTAVMPLVRLRSVHLTDGNGRPCVPMDLCEGGR